MQCSSMDYILNRQLINNCFLVDVPAVQRQLVLIVALSCCSSKQERVDQGIEAEGSNLSGVSAKCVWDDLSRPPEDEEDSRSICIGSQPRRLSDKGRSRRRLATTRGGRQEESTMQLLVCWQTRSRSGRPWGKDWSSTAKQRCRPSAARDRVTRDLSECSSHTAHGAATSVLSAPARHTWHSARFAVVSDRNLRLFSPLIRSISDAFTTILLFFLCRVLRSRKDSLESESSAAIVPHELVRTRQLESVHLKFNQESGTLLPLCLR